jgi:hypothetical protein
MTEAAVHRQHEDLFSGAAGVEGGAQTAHQIGETGGQVVDFLSGSILFPLRFQRGEGLGAFPGKPCACAWGACGGAFDHRNFLESHGQGTGTDLGLAK